MHRNFIFSQRVTPQFHFAKKAGCLRVTVWKRSQMQHFCWEKIHGLSLAQVAFSLRHVNKHQQKVADIVHATYTRYLAQ